MLLKKQWLLGLCLAVAPMVTMAEGNIIWGESLYNGSKLLASNGRDSSGNFPLTTSDLSIGDIETLIKKVEQLKRDQDEMKDQLKSLQNKSASGLKESNDQLSKRINDLENDNKDMARQIKDLKQENDQLSSSLKDLSNKVK